MKLRTVVDILWAVVAAGGTLAGIVACAHIQGSMHTPGIRFALIGLAVALGIMGGVVLARVTSGRRRRHRTGHSRRTRRHMRTVAFAISGVIIACTVVGLYLIATTWLVAALGLGGLAVTWLWYAVETLGLSRGAVTTHHRHSRSSHHDDRHGGDRDDARDDDDDDGDERYEHGADYPDGRT